MKEIIRFKNQKRRLSVMRFFDYFKKEFGVPVTFICDFGTQEIGEEVYYSKNNHYTITFENGTEISFVAEKKKEY